MTIRCRIFLVLALGWALAIAWGSLTPGSSLPNDLPWDKLNHVTGYGGLTLGLIFAGWRWPRAAGAAFGYGVVIEYAQLLVPGRSGGDWADILANTLGVICAALLAAFIEMRRATRG